MNSSYNDVLDQSKTMWKFQRLELVLEFMYRDFPFPALFPFNILIILLRLVRCRVDACMCWCIYWACTCIECPLATLPFG